MFVRVRICAVILVLVVSVSQYLCQNLLACAFVLQVNTSLKCAIVGVARTGNTRRLSLTPQVLSLSLSRYLSSWGEALFKSYYTARPLLPLQ